MVKQNGAYHLFLLANLNLDLKDFLNSLQFNLIRKHKNFCSNLVLAGSYLGIFNKHQELAPQIWGFDLGARGLKYYAKTYRSTGYNWTECFNLGYETHLLIFGCVFLIAGVFSKYTYRPVEEKKYTLLVHSIFIVLLGVFIAQVSPWIVFYSGKLFPFIDIANFLKGPIVLVGGLLNVNFFTQGIKLFLSLLTVLIFLMYINYRRHSKMYDFEYAVLLIFALLSAFLLVSAFDVISTYVAIEALSFCGYILAAFDRKNVFSAEAGLKYFILGAIASGFILFGFVMIKGIFGYTQFIDLRQLFIFDRFFSAKKSFGEIGLLEVSIIFVIAGYFFKVSAAPFHNWAPDVYGGSPIVSTAFFSTVVKLAFLASFVKVISTIFLLEAFYWGFLTFFVAAGSIVVGALGAGVQKDLKRIAAYSSINHVGFILLGVTAFGAEFKGPKAFDIYPDTFLCFAFTTMPDRYIGIPSALFYMIFYTLMNIGFFAALLALREKGTGKYFTNIYDLGALKRDNPGAAFLFTIIIFSLAGIPPLLGFFNKFMVIFSLVHADLLFFAVVAVLGSVLSVYYYLRIVAVMYFMEPEKIKGTEPAEPVLMKLLIFSFVLVTLGPVFFSEMWYFADSLGKSVHYWNLAIIR